MDASVPLPPPTIFRPTTSAKARTKGDCACRAFLFALHLLENHRQAAENQADKRHVRRQRIRAEQERDQQLDPNAEHHAQRIRPKHFDAAFEVLEQRIDAADDRVVNAHGNHHRAAAYAGDDVGQTDDHAAQNVKIVFMLSSTSNFGLIRGFCRKKIVCTSKRCVVPSAAESCGIFSLLLYQQARFFVNRFFEILTFAWRVCRSTQNIDVFASG